MTVPSGLESSLAEPPADGVFGEDLVEGVPDPVQRYFTAAIARGTPLARSARLRMRGQIKVGRWLPFRARQVLNPRRGTVWRARVGGVISGSDHYADGRGAMVWKLGGLIPVVRADGPDVSRSSAERAAGEAFWLPTSLLPRLGVTWSATDDAHIHARFDVDGHEVQVNYTIDDDGRVRSLAFDRWSDPDDTGTWGRHTFGCEVSEHATFDGVTVPSAGSAGWFFGTDRWAQGAFFRFRVTALSLVKSEQT